MCNVNFLLKRLANFSSQCRYLTDFIRVPVDDMGLCRAWPLTFRNFWSRQAQHSHNNVKHLACDQIPTLVVCKQQLLSGGGDVQFNCHLFCKGFPGLLHSILMDTLSPVLNTCHRYGWLVKQSEAWIQTVSVAEQMLGGRRKAGRLAREDKWR